MADQLELCLDMNGKPRPTGSLTFPPGSRPGLRDAVQRTLPFASLRCIRRHPPPPAARRLRHSRPLWMDTDLIFVNARRFWLLQVNGRRENRSRWTKSSTYDASDGISCGHEKRNPYFLWRSDNDPGLVKLYERNRRPMHVDYYNTRRSCKGPSNMGS